MNNGHRPEKKIEREMKTNNMIFNAQKVIL